MLLIDMRVGSKRKKPKQYYYSLPTQRPLQCFKVGKRGEEGAI